MTLKNAHNRTVGKVNKIIYIMLIINVQIDAQEMSKAIDLKY